LLFQQALLDLDTALGDGGATYPDFDSCFGEGRAGHGHDIRTHIYTVRVVEHPCGSGRTDDLDWLDLVSTTAQE
jgi:hypothetical protein